ncbi:MAG: glycine cleavage T C-terminal barrel domain-containing protein, partial [Halobacteriaceae archaeon]
ADKSNEIAIFGIHGPMATEKLASVLNQAGAPEEPLTFNRGKISDSGVTVIRNDGLVGEEGYEIVCDHNHTATVFDTLLNHGLNAVPFGLETWNILTLEAGTPLYETELRDRIPLLVGTRNALDLEKGCFVGQEVVSRIENRGQIRERLIGLELESSVSESATVMIDGNDVGNITRVKESPTCNSPIAFALCKMTEINGEITVSEDNISTSAKQRTFPFVTGSDTSA